MPRHQLAVCLPEPELALYAAYAQERPMPLHRLELMLAQVCQLLVRLNSKSDPPLSDFILRFEAPQEISDEADLDSHFGFMAT